MIKTNRNSNIAVIIPAYNEAKNIKETIESVKEQSKKADKILVVDDCSTDNTGEVARKNGAEVIKTLENTGTKSQAQNHGLQFISEKEYPIVITIDADTTLDERAFEKIIPHLGISKVASVCGFVIPRKIKTKWEKARFIEYLFGISICKSAQSLWGAPLVSSGCFSAFDTKLLKQFNGFPDRSMTEDMDLTWQQLEAGYTVILEPYAICYPISPHDYNTYRGQVERWLRGFLQNIQLHKFKILRNKKLAFFITWYLAEGLMFPISLVFVVFIARRFGWLVLSIPLIDAMIVSISALWRAKKEDKFGSAMKSIGWYYVIRLVNAYLFFKSIWKEWIIGERLQVWEKGH